MNKLLLNTKFENEMKSNNQKRLSEDLSFNYNLNNKNVLNDQDIVNCNEDDIRLQEQIQNRKLYNKEKIQSNNDRIS